LFFKYIKNDLFHFEYVIVLFWKKKHSEGFYFNVISFKKREVCNATPDH